MTMNDERNYVYDVHTGLYSDKAFEVFSTVWHWHNMPDLVSRFKPARANDGEVVLRYKSYYPDRWIENRVTSGATKRAWAGFLKSACTRKMKHADGEFAPDSTCTLTVSWTDWDNNHTEMNSVVAVKDVRFLYDWMFEHKRILPHFAEDYKNEMIGIPRDPITTSIYDTLESEIKVLKTESKDKINKLNDECDKEVDAAKSQIRAKYQALKDAETAELNKKIADLKASLGNIAA